MCFASILSTSRYIVARDVGSSRCAHLRTKKNKKKNNQNNKSQERELRVVLFSPRKPVELVQGARSEKKGNKTIRRKKNKGIYIRI